MTKNNIYKCFVSGNTPSSKNSKQWTGKLLVSSKTVKNYLKEKGIISYNPSKKEVKTYKRLENVFIKETEGLKEFLVGKEKPFRIGMYFIRQDKRKFDYINIAQIIFDLLTAHDIIEDDNMTEIIPVFLGFEVNKDNPGVILILEC